MIIILIFLISVIFDHISNCMATTTTIFYKSMNYQNVVFGHAQIQTSRSSVACGQQCLSSSGCIGFHASSGQCFVYSTEVNGFLYSIPKEGSILFEKISESTTGDVCENGIANLQCFSGQVIRVESGFFGRLKPGSEVCSHPSTQNTTCEADQSTVKLAASELCDNLMTCEISDPVATFGDPCMGTYKYFNIQYSCLFM